MSLNPQQLPITLIVITYNEAANIARCLDSVPFAAEKLVVDSVSTDDTVAIAQRHGARVIQQAWLGFGAQRNFATKAAAHDWILFLDADEWLSPELAEEMQRELPSLISSNKAGAILRRQAWCMGAPMRWYRPMVGESMERLYHRDRAKWTEPRVHEALRFSGDAVRFRSPFHHQDALTLVHKHLKILRYSELKTNDWLERNRSTRLWECPFVFIGTFLKDYFLRLAFLDGWRGFIVAYVAASYAIYKRIRYYEMRANPLSRELGGEALRKHSLDR